MDFRLPCREKDLDVFGTHTIRRKLLLSLSVVCLMLIVMSVGGIRGLLSYRSMVHYLELAEKAPHQADLVESLIRLCEPLTRKPVDEEAIQVQRQQFLDQVVLSRQAIADFLRRLDNMPLSELPDAQGPITKSMLLAIDEELYNIGVQVSDPRKVDSSWPDMSNRVAAQLVRAQMIPDPVAGMRGMLKKARRDYSTSLTLVWMTSVATLIMFLVLSKAAHRGIFVPITVLHQGARRVARGDFDYRVRLQTRDEMAELAESFNQMTARFQEIAGDLETQVRDRSRQLVRSERLAGVGFLAAGVAHEINNPLSAISMAAESLEDRLRELLEAAQPADAQIVRQYLSMMQSEAERCRQITARLLDFSRGRDSSRTRTDVTQVVSEVVSMVQFLSKYRDKKIDFNGDKSCYAETNAPEIKQVVLNLVANGLDAMESGGTLRIEAEEQTDHVLLKFMDEGCGMTPDIIESIFEPFFTQKRVGQGTGLGLSISHRIVSEHGGTISASSPGPGQGSTFTVRLPRKAAAARDAA